MTKGDLIRALEIYTDEIDIFVAPGGANPQPILSSLYKVSRGATPACIHLVTPVDGGAES